MKGAHNMSKGDLRSLIERNILELELLRKIKSVTYMMEFGEIAVQFECSLN